ncbi:MAG: hypothetical protein Q4G30_09210 [Actinomycetaceae bacterium]|nr:hypothetical protein [Actinomycetaceae bacterium]
MTSGNPVGNPAGRQLRPPTADRAVKAPTSAKARSAKHPLVSVFAAFLALALIVLLAPYGTRALAQVALPTDPGTDPGADEGLVKIVDDPDNPDDAIEDPANDPNQPRITLSTSTAVEGPNNNAADQLTFGEELTIDITIDVPAPAKGYDAAVALMVDAPQGTHPFAEPSMNRGFSFGYIDPETGQFTAFDNQEIGSILGVGQPGDTPLPTLLSDVLNNGQFLPISGEALSPLFPETGALRLVMSITTYIPDLHKLDTTRQLFAGSTIELSAWVRWAHERSAHSEPLVLTVVEPAPAITFTATPIDNKIISEGGAYGSAGEKMYRVEVTVSNDSTAASLEGAIVNVCMPKKYRGEEVATLVSGMDMVLGENRLYPGYHGPSQSKDPDYRVSHGTVDGASSNRYNCVGGPNGQNAGEHSLFNVLWRGPDTQTKASVKPGEAGTRTLVFETSMRPGPWSGTDVPYAWVEGYSLWEDGKNYSKPRFYSAFQELKKEEPAPTPEPTGSPTPEPTGSPTPEPSGTPTPQPTSTPPTPGNTSAPVPVIPSVTPSERDPSPLSQIVKEILPLAPGKVQVPAQLPPVAGASIVQPAQVNPAAGLPRMMFIGNVSQRNIKTGTVSSATPGSRLGLRSASDETLARTGGTQLVPLGIGALLFAGAGLVLARQTRRSR